MLCCLELALPPFGIGILIVSCLNKTVQIPNIYIYIYFKTGVYEWSAAILKHCLAFKILSLFQVEVVEGVAGEDDHHDEQEEHGEENAEAEGQHDEHDEDGMHSSF